MLRIMMQLCRIWFFLLFLYRISSYYHRGFSVKPKSQKIALTPVESVVDHIDAIYEIRGATSVLLNNQVDVSQILSKAANRALSGGTAGASAAAVQVVSLMWLRTAINYQYRYGTNTTEALRTLYEEGGIVRLYQGLPFALVQGPLSRFGDTAANALLASIFDSIDPTSVLYPLPLRTAAGSATAGLWRILLMPIDTAKTVMQVEGSQALPALLSNVQQQGPGVLFNGAVASSAATFVGHFPWFLTFNYLSDHLLTTQQFVQDNADFVSMATGAGVDIGSPAGAALLSLPMLGAVAVPPIVDVKQLTAVLDLVRSAFIGLCASSASDVCSNSLRVLKTTRQTYAMGTTASGTNNGTSSSASDSTGANGILNDATASGGRSRASGVDDDKGSTSSSGISSPNPSSSSYVDIAKTILREDGWNGLLGRGLQTRLLSNALQGMLFSVLFKLFQQQQS